MLVPVTRTSPFTGKSTTKMIEMTVDQIRRYNEGKEPIQNIFPELSADDREFIKTGITADEWPSE